MSVAFGVNLPSHRPDITVDAIRTLALTAEALDFDSVVMADHVALPKRVASTYPYAADGVSSFRPDVPLFEPLSTLLYLAGCTSRIRLGFNVLIVPYRPPVLTAKMLAMLDVLSDGRLIAGLGVGWMEEEFVALGVDTFDARGSVTDEYIEIFKVLWTSEDTTFNGRFAQVPDVGVLPRPVQQPHPPIWIGGHTDVALRRAARYGDAWLPLGTFPPAVFPPAAMAAKVERLRELTVAAGRTENDVGLCFGGLVHFDESNPADRRPLQGSVEQIVSDLTSYAALGVTHFILYFQQPGQGAPTSAWSEHMSRFSEEVAPLVS